MRHHRFLIHVKTIRGTSVFSVVGRWHHSNKKEGKMKDLFRCGELNRKCGSFDPTGEKLAISRQI